jgi:hypothetical protein
MIASRTSRRVCFGVGFATLLTLAAATPPAIAHDTLNDIGGTPSRGELNPLGDKAHQAQPWVRKYLGIAGTCLHLQITTLSTLEDLEMVVIAPSPLQRYRDDDSGSTSTCTNCPRVEIDPVPITGYYTVIVNQFAGTGVSTEFVLDYARRTSGIGSCPNPTTPLPLSPALAAPKM